MWHRWGNNENKSTCVRQNHGVKLFFGHQCPKYKSHGPKPLSMCWLNLRFVSYQLGKRWDEMKSAVARCREAMPTQCLGHTLSATPVAVGAGRLAAIQIFFYQLVKVSSLRLKEVLKSTDFLIVITNITLVNRCKRPDIISFNWCSYSETTCKFVKLTYLPF